MPSSKPYSDFGHRLDSIIREHGLKQSELLRKLQKVGGNWSKSVLSNLVRGITRPSPDRIDQLTEALGCSRDMLDPRYRGDVVRESPGSLGQPIKAMSPQIPVLGDRGVPSHPSYDPIRSYVDVGAQFNIAGLRAWVNTSFDATILVKRGDTLIVRPHTVLREGLIFICEHPSIPGYLVKTVASVNGQLEVRTLMGEECEIALSEIDILGYLVGLQSWNSLLQIGPYSEGLTVQQLRSELLDRLG